MRYGWPVSLGLLSLLILQPLCTSAFILCDYDYIHSTIWISSHSCVSLAHKKWPRTHNSKLEERSKSARCPLDRAELLISKLRPLHHCTAATFTHNCKSLCIIAERTVEQRRGMFLGFQKGILINTCIMQYGCLCRQNILKNEWAGKKILTIYAGFYAGLFQITACWVTSKITLNQLRLFTLELNTLQ